MCLILKSSVFSAFSQFWKNDKDFKKNHKSLEHRNVDRSNDNVDANIITHVHVDNDIYLILLVVIPKLIDLKCQLNNRVPILSVRSVAVNERSSFVSFSSVSRMRSNRPNIICTQLVIVCPFKINHFVPHKSFQETQSKRCNGS